VSLASPAALDPPRVRAADRARVPRRGRADRAARRIGLDDRSEPEPDVCVVQGSPRDYVHAHPTRPALIVEVALSGLGVARGRKAAAYARARITDYWIVNLVDRVLEVHRKPARPGPARRGWGYAAIETFGADATVTPLAAPSAAIHVADLLP
jgi:Uma2 family endonuclease